MSRHEELRKAKRAARQAEKKKRQREAHQRMIDERDAIEKAQHERHIAKEAKATGQSVEAVKMKYRQHGITGTDEFADHFAYDLMKTNEAIKRRVAIMKRKVENLKQKPN